MQAPTSTTANQNAVYERARRDFAVRLVENVVFTAVATALFPSVHPPYGLTTEEACALIFLRREDEPFDGAARLEVI